MTNEQTTPVVKYLCTVEFLHKISFRRKRKVNVVLVEIIFFYQKGKAIWQHFQILLRYIKSNKKQDFLNKIGVFWTHLLAWSSFLLASLLLLTARSVSVCHPIQVVSVCERGSTAHRARLLLLLVKTCKPWLLWTQSHQMGKNEVLG